MKKKICMLLFGVISLFVVCLLAYNSFYKLSYSRRVIGKYTFQLPKEIESISIYNNFYMKHEYLMEGYVSVNGVSYSVAEDKLLEYTFYPADVKVISKEESEVNGKKLYYFLKELNYYDTPMVSYMFNYVYEFEEDKLFIISGECSDLEYVSYMKKILKKSVTSINLY